MSPGCQDALRPSSGSTSGLVSRCARPPQSMHVMIGSGSSTGPVSPGPAAICEHRRMALVARVVASAPSTTVTLVDLDAGALVREATVTHDRHDPDSWWVGLQRAVGEVA